MQKAFHRAALILPGLFFIAGGINHFLHSAFYVRIVPPWLPAPTFLVAMSGIFEFFGGLGTLIPATRRIAGIGLITLLIAVFPANVQMVLHPELYRDMGTQTAFLFRLPLQGVLIAWVWWTCLRSR